MYLRRRGPVQGLAVVGPPPTALRCVVEGSPRPESPVDVFQNRDDLALANPLTGAGPSLPVSCDAPSRQRASCGLLRTACATRQFLIGGPMLAQLPVTGSPASVFFTKGTE